MTKWHKNTHCWKTSHSMRCCTMCHEAWSSKVDSQCHVVWSICRQCVGALIRCTTSNLCAQSYKVSPSVAHPSTKMPSNRNSFCCLLGSMVARQAAILAGGLPCLSYKRWKDDQNSLVRKDSDLLQTHRRLRSIISVHIIHTCSKGTTNVQNDEKNGKVIQKTSKDSTIRLQ